MAKEPTTIFPEQSVQSAMAAGDDGTEFESD
jgi:hypothetical protein